MRNLQQKKTSGTRGEARGAMVSDAATSTALQARPSGQYPDRADLLEAAKRVRRNIRLARERFDRISECAITGTTPEESDYVTASISLHRALENIDVIIFDAKQTPSARGSKRAKPSRTRAKIGAVS